MSGQYTYRWVSRSDGKDKIQMVQQRRRFWIFWQDWYPANNAVRSLQHEFIELVQRAEEILVELKDAKNWVDGVQNQFNLEYPAKGKGKAFKEKARKREFPIPMVEEHFKKYEKQFKRGFKNQYSGQETTVTAILGKFGRNDLSHLNRQALGDKYDAKHIMDYRPEPKQQSRKQKGQQNQQNNQRGNQQGNQTPKDPNNAWFPDDDQNK